MSKNLSPSALDQNMIMQRSFDGDNDALRMELASGVSFAVELDHTDNIVILGTEDGSAGGTYHALKVDSNGVLFIRADSVSGSTASLSSASSGVVLSPISCLGIKSFQIYAQVTAEASLGIGITGNIKARIDISPTSSGSTFFQTSTELDVPALSALNSVVVSALLTNIIGSRVQLSLVENNLVGADRVKFYLVGSSL